jgi:hypothetical protein
MRVKEGDYAICKERQEGRKDRTFLIRVDRVKEHAVLGTLERDPHIKRVQLDVETKNIVCNLGPDPHPGRVHGIDTGFLYRKSFDHPFWGEIHFFTKLDKLTIKAFRSALDTSAKIVQKAKLQEFTTCVLTEISAKNGKWAGKYIHGGREKPNRVRYAPEFAAGNRAAMEYVILHEFGHVVRFNGLTTPKWKARWVNAYRRSVEPTVVTKDQLRAFHKAVFANPEGSASFTTALNDAVEDKEDNKIAMKAILRWIKDTHRLTVKDLSILYQSKNIDDLESVWPTGIVDTSKLKPLITEYATKNPEETFAEAFAFHLTGKKLPKSITGLMEESIRYASVKGVQHETDTSPGDSGQT